MLSPETIAIVKATIPALEANGELLTRHFYRRMFAGNPEIRAFFNPAHQHSGGGQQRALAASILAYATHIENPAVLGPAVELIAQKHASLGVKAEHYPIVGKHLLASIREVLGEAATDAVINAWAEAFGVLAGIFVKREGQIYDEHRERHGWEGMKPFVVRLKRRESATITSFYLEPADGSPVRPFQAGQYVTVRVPGTWHETTMRNYSLSGKPGEPYYRISVKREPRPAGRSIVAPAGHVSNLLHDHVNVGDTLQVGPPCGEFVLRPPSAAGRPLVLIGGGVGVTPVLSMLHAALADPQHAGRDIWFINATLNGQTLAFAEEVRALAAKHPRLKVHIRYSEVTAAEGELNRHDSEGVVDLTFLEALLDGPEADFYFCGPKPMMVAVYQGLKAWGVPAGQIHYEFFGPLQALEQPREAAAEPIEAAAVV